MAIWLEIHCDVKSTGPPDPKRVDAFCFTNRGDNPGILGFSDRVRMKKALDVLKGEARRKGWVKRRDGSWECPSCFNPTRL